MLDMLGSYLHLVLDGLLILILFPELLDIDTRSGNFDIVNPCGS
jgi:hypothetical protein